MPGDERYTAYCGLYCKDCIPSNQKLFETADTLAAMLEGLQFEKYAELKSRETPAFGEYNVFLHVLTEIKGLQCRAICTADEPKDDCGIRACARDKGYRGCWECGQYETCGLLAPLKVYHPDLTHNLRMIREHGPDEWSEKRGRHYNWSRNP